jgi:lipoprotein NlpD
VEGKVISVFGMRRSSAINKGIDIQTLEGTEILAARGGKVSFIHERMPGLGRTVILDHGDGFATVYAYIGEILVHPGQNVSQRQVIARVGRSGRALVPALHFEIRRNQRPQNPFYYLP